MTVNQKNHSRRSSSILLNGTNECYSRIFKRAAPLFPREDSILTSPLATRPPDPTFVHNYCCHNYCCHNYCCHNYCCHNYCCHNYCCHNYCCHNYCCRWEISHFHKQISITPDNVVSQYDNVQYCYRKKTIATSTESWISRMPSGVAPQTKTGEHFWDKSMPWWWRYIRNFSGEVFHVNRQKSAILLAPQRKHKRELRFPLTKGGGSIFPSQLLLTACSDWLTWCVEDRTYVYGKRKCFCNAQNWNNALCVICFEHHCHWDVFTHMSSFLKPASSLSLS